MTPSLKFENDGVELLAALPPDDYMQAAGYALNFAHRRDKATGGEHGGYGAEREFHDHVLDGDEIYKQAPALFDVYLKCHDLAAQRLAGQHLVNLSPWRRSAITLKTYTRPGDEHGWHVESNGLTVIWVLQGPAFLDCMQPGCKPNTGTLTSIGMVSGEAWLLRGHDVWHCVPPVSAEALPRTTAILNYYLDNDFSRPEGIDEQHYA